MPDERLPPKNLHLTLPALTAREADELISLIDALQTLLWDAYGHDIALLYGDRGPADELSDAPAAVDDIPF
jgi:hypothetical protein